MPITIEQFVDFKAAGIEQAREMAEAFIPDINNGLIAKFQLPKYIGKSVDGVTPLIALCRGKESIYKEEKLKLLLALGADPNLVREGYGTVLMQALAANEGPEFIEILLNAKADINLPDDEGETAAFAAVRARRLNELRTLHGRGLSVNHKAKNGQTALHVALEKCWADLDIVPTLIELGSDVNAKDGNGMSPLALSVSEKECPVSTIQLLVEAGAVVDAVDDKGMSPLLHASRQGYTEAVRFLLERKASVVHRDAMGRSALHWCCHGGWAEIIPVLVNAGADTDIQDKSGIGADEGSGGQTPLMYAVGSADSTKELLQFSPGVDVVDNKGRSALMHACAKYAQASVVKMLLERGAKVEVSDFEGNTALHLLTTGPGPEDAVVRLLLSAKADPNAVNYLGETPLMLCSETKSIELLVKGGANVDDFDKAGKTALIHGANRCAPDAYRKINILLNAKANTDIRDDEGKTALMHAVRSDDCVKSVRLLVDHGAHLDLQDKKGKPATAYASPDNLMLLITAGAKPSAFEGDALLNAVREDNLPLAARLLERDAKLKLNFEHFVMFKAVLKKLAQANANLLRAGVVCTDLEAQEQFDELLAKFAKSHDIAGDADLPEVLRRGAWPIQISARKKIILAAGRASEIRNSIEDCRGVIEWPEGLRDSVVYGFEEYSSDKNQIPPQPGRESAQDYLAGLLKKKGKISFAAIFKNWGAGSDAEFIDFWNANGAAITEKIGINAHERACPMNANEIAHLLARFDVAVLPGILDAYNESPKFADALRFVDAPGCASVMARELGYGPTRHIAREWALKFPESCTKGLIVAAVSKSGKDRATAEATLRFLGSNGHKKVVESVAARFGDDVFESIAETLAQDHRADFMPAKIPRLPEFWCADAYPAPRLKSNNKELPAYAVAALANMMSLSSIEARIPSLEAVIEACEPKSLASFAWGAFEEWAEKGQANSEWIFDSLSYLGDDTCARKLTSCIRSWPGENRMARARKGLQILAAIGTDVALSQIQAIS